MNRAIESSSGGRGADCGPPPDPPFTGLWPGEHVAGIDICGNHVTVSRLMVIGNSIRLRNIGYAKLDTELDEKSKAAAIRRLWSSARIHTKTVATCLRSRSLVLKYCRYPRLTTEELRSTMALEVEAALQLPHDEIAFDWHQTSGGSPTDGETLGCAIMEGILVAAPRKEVDAHLGLLRAAGLFPVIVDVSCLAITNLFLSLQDYGQENEKSCCLVHLSEGSADIAVLYGRAAVYPRTVVTAAGSWEERADYVIESVRDALMYAQFKLRFPAVSKVFVMGWCPRGEAFDARLAATVDVPEGVEAWDPFSGLHHIHGRSSKALDRCGEAQSLLLPGLGVGLRRD